MHTGNVKSLYLTSHYFANIRFIIIIFAGFTFLLFIFFTFHFNNHDPDLAFRVLSIFKVSWFDKMNELRPKLNLCRNTM